MTKVQILIPAYNAEKTLGKTIESLLGQTFKNFEILVVDNCSTDKTHEVVESFKDERLHYIRNEKNLGNYGNFDRCIGLAGFDYTAIFHADDIYLPTIIEEQVRVLDSNAKVGAVFTEAEKVNNNLENIGHLRTPLFTGGDVLAGVIYFDFERLLKAIIHNNCFLLCPSAMVRSSIYKNEIIRTRVEYFGAAADVDVWLRVARSWSVAIIKKELMRYRISVAQHTYQINKNRLVRSEYALIANYYRVHFESILKNFNLSIKREKIIDLIVRLGATERNSRKFYKYKKIILASFLDFRIFLNFRWWKYFLKFLLIEFRLREIHGKFLH